MRLIELFEEITDEYLNNPLDIDRVYNPENYDYTENERQRRKKLGTGVVKKDLPKDPETRYSNKPKSDDIKSSGYVGQERIKKRLDRKYDKSAFSGPAKNHLSHSYPSNNPPFNIMGK